MGRGCQGGSGETKGEGEERRGDDQKGRDEEKREGGRKGEEGGDDSLAIPLNILRDLKIFEKLTHISCKQMQ